MKNTYIYAFPLDRLPRNSKTEDIIKDYNRDDLPADHLQVKKYTVEEFCELINDDMFNDQKYYARAVEEDDEVSQTVNDLYDRYKKDIISLMRSEKLEEIEFDDNDGDLVYVFWQDRYDMWNRDPIVKVSIKDNNLVFDCRTDNDETVTLYSSSDYGCDLVEVLSDLLFLIQEYVSQLEPACPYCGSREPRDGKNALLICTSCGNEYWPGQTE